MEAAGELSSDRYRLLCIERRLCADLQTARSDKAAAAQRFNEVLEQVPTGIPSPDSNLGIKQAGSEYHRAKEACRLALHRFTDFLVSGIVPDDLKD